MQDETKKLGLEELFREVVSEMSANLATFAETLRTTTPNSECCQEAYCIAHSLHGSGKLYGYPCVSELGASLEKLTKALQDCRTPPTPALASLIASCSTALSGLADATVPDETARATIRDLAWECECALHATPDAAPSPIDPEAASPASQ
jgi:chemotaxis protein histidine kinase CheA